MKKCWIFVALLSSVSAYADQFLCATNMQYVYTGDTIDSVIAACGQPNDRIEQSSSNAAAGNLIWYYQMGGNSALTNAVGGNNSGLTVSAGQLVPPGAAVAINKSHLTITSTTQAPVNFGVVFNNGQVASIQQRGNNNASQEMQSFNCASGTIQVGSSMSDVSAACGLPIIQKNMSQQPAASVPTQPVTLLVYKPQEYLPAQTLVFKNGLLAGQKQ
jgi:hypothetical protein